MGALGIKRNRSIDSLWEVNEKTIMALESTLGVVIGSDDGRVLYIQDTGVKEVGRGYIDRATKKVHICKERTEDVINTSAKFEDISVDTINNKLQNLVRTSLISTTDTSLFELKYNDNSVSINTLGVYGRELIVGETVIACGFISGTITPSASIEAPFEGSFKIRVSKSAFPNIKTISIKNIYGNATVTFNGSTVDSAMCGAILRNNTSDGYIELSINDYPFYDGAGGAKFQVASVRCEFSFVY